MKNPQIGQPKLHMHKKTDRAALNRATASGWFASMRWALMRAMAVILW